MNYWGKECYPYKLMYQSYTVQWNKSMYNAKWIPDEDNISVQYRSSFNLGIQFVSLWLLPCQQGNLCAWLSTKKTDKQAYSLIIQCPVNHSLKPISGLADDQTAISWAMILTFVLSHANFLLSWPIFLFYFLELELKFRTSKIWETCSWLHVGIY